METQTVYDRMRIHRENRIDSFYTLHINREYTWGEVPRRFFNTFSAELGPIWRLIDYSGRKTTVKFNQSAEHPLLIDGWDDLRRFYEIDGDRMVMFSYYRDDLFLISVMNNQPIEAYVLAPEHTYHLNEGHIYYFGEVTLTKYQATGSKLTLRNEIGMFLRSTNYDQVRMFGAEGTEVTVTVLKRKKGGQIVTEFGSKWQELCHLNVFKEGNTLKFGFIKNSVSNLMKIIKV